jgi:hypothetical protein
MQFGVNMTINKASLILATLTAVTGCAPSVQSNIGPQVTFGSGFKTLALQGLPSTVSRFKIKPFELRMDVAQQDAAKYGVNGPSFDSGDTLIFSEGTKALRIDRKTGAKFFEDTSSMWGANSQKPQINAPGNGGMPQANVPSESQCIEMAKAYIKTHADTHADEPVFFQANETRQSISDGSTEAKPNSNVVQREIVFRRIVDGKIVLGNGSQISVFVGDNGKINGIFIDWPELERIRQVKLRSSSEALNDLPSVIQSENKPLQSGQRIKTFSAKRMKLGWSGVLHADGSREIIPAFAVLGTTERENGSRDEIKLLSASDEARLNQTTSLPEEAANTGGANPPGPLTKEAQ